MRTILQINTSLYAEGGASSRLLALGAEDRESSLAGAGKCIELLAA